jgi:hypothetical protein
VLYGAPVKDGEWNAIAESTEYLRMDQLLNGVKHATLEVGVQAQSVAV